MKRSGKRVWIRILATVALLGLMVGAVYLKRVADYQRAVREIVIEEVSARGLPDGSYVGECDVGLIRARVEVTVRGGAIADIEILEHKNGRGQPAERVVEDILSQQRIDVDGISGATNSSTVLKKAVEEALEGAGPG